MPPSWSADLVGPLSQHNQLIIAACASPSALSLSLSLSLSLFLSLSLPRSPSLAPSASLQVDPVRLSARSNMGVPISDVWMRRCFINLALLCAWAIAMRTSPKRNRPQVRTGERMSSRPVAPLSLRAL